jgi:hypothetical protein
LNETGTFKAKASCRDGYSGLDTETRLQVVQNTSCNAQNENPSEQDYATTADAAADADFLSAIGTFRSTFGVSGKLAGSVVTIIMCIIIGVGIFMSTRSEVLTIVCIPLILLLSYFMGFSGLFPIILMVIVLIAYIVYKLTTGQSQGV